MLSPVRTSPKIPSRQLFSGLVECHGTSFCFIPFVVRPSVGRTSMRSFVVRAGVPLRGAGDKSTWTAPAVTFQPMGVLWTSAPRSKGLEELFLAMATCCFLLAVIQS